MTFIFLNFFRRAWQNKPQKNFNQENHAIPDFHCQILILREIFFIQSLILFGYNSPQLAALPFGSLLWIPRQLAAGWFIEF